MKHLIGWVVVITFIVSLIVLEGLIGGGATDVRQATPTPTTEQQVL